MSKGRKHEQKNFWNSVSASRFVQLDFPCKNFKKSISSMETENHSRNWILFLQEGLIKYEDPKLCENLSGFRTNACMFCINQYKYPLIADKLFQIQMIPSSVDNLYMRQLCVNSVCNQSTAINSARTFGSK